MADQMTSEEMAAVINAAQPGDKLCIVFVDRQRADLKGQLYFIMMMCGRVIDIGELPLLNLLAVANTGEWQGFTKYTATVLDGFDPEYFIKRTVTLGLLVSVNKVG